jgi:predicted acyltransferase (DUF342 family)
MNRPEYEFFSFFKKIEYFFSFDKINFKLLTSVSKDEIDIDCNAIIKDKSNLNIKVKTGNSLIISNLTDTNIQAEKDVSLFIYNSFSGNINGKAHVSLQKNSKITGNITCYKIAVSNPLFGKSSSVEFDGELNLKSS